MIRWRPSQELVVLVSYTVALYMTVVDSTIIYTALPSLARDFHSSLDSAQWVTLSYLLSLAVVVPSSGWIGDRFGTRRTFLIALVLFTGASVLCGLSGSLTQLVIFRVIQGIGGGLIIPVGQAMLFRTFPPARRARAAGMVALGTSLGPATGPVLGGILTTYLSWRWCFFVNIPFGAAALAIGLLFLAEHREPAAGRLDLPGFVLAGGGLGLFLYALSEAPVRGWGSPVVIGTGVAGVVALAALVAVELRSKAPMLNLRLLRNRIFRTTNLVSVCNLGVYSAYLFLMPEFLQLARGASALSSGLTTFPGAIGVWTSSQIAARIYPRVGPRRMAVGGAVRRDHRLLPAGARGRAGHQHLGDPAADPLQRVRERFYRHRGPGLVVRDHLPGRHRPGVRAVPDPDPDRGQYRRGRAGHRRLGRRPGRGDRCRAGPRVPLRVPDRRRDNRPGGRVRADHPGRRRRGHHAPPEQIPAPAPPAAGVPRGPERAPPTPGSPRAGLAGYGLAVASRIGPRAGLAGRAATGGQGSARPASWGSSVSWLASGSGRLASGPAEPASGHCLSSTCGISQLARKASAAIGTAIRNTVWIDSA